MRIEAPNWSSDGAWLVFNGEGCLWRTRADGSGTPERFDTGSVRTIGNDHLFSPDGLHLYFTADGVIHRVPVAGGVPHQLSRVDEAEPVLLFLHGISPDSQWLSCTGMQQRTGRLAVHVLPTAGGTSRCIADPGVAIDGPEYSPDGQWIYFNAELHGRRPGDAQLFRMRPDGTGIEQLTRDDRVNWFPHVSPDGSRVAYLSYASGTMGHPADRHVLLRCLDLHDGGISDVVALFGGQGTLNCNSWAPDSARLAFVAYS